MPHPAASPPSPFAAPLAPEVVRPRRPDLPLQAEAVAPAAERGDSLPRMSSFELQAVEGGVLLLAVGACQRVVVGPPPKRRPHRAVAGGALDAQELLGGGAPCDS